VSGKTPNSIGEEIVMNTPVSGSAEQLKVGGLGALYLAAAYIVAMSYFLVVVKYTDVVDPVEKVSSIVANHSSLLVINLVTYEVFGIVLAILALSLHARLRRGAPVLSQAGAVVGCIWATMLVASGLVNNAGGAAVVALQATNPAQAVSVWQAVEPVADGLGSAGGELLGGLWVVLVSVAGLRAAAFPKAMSWFGLAVGAAGVVSVVPGLAAGAYVFGLLQIVWFAWLGIALIRAATRRAVPAELRVRGARRPSDDRVSANGS
jgi:hypothetical protein